MRMVLDADMVPPVQVVLVTMSAMLLSAASAATEAVKVEITADAPGARLSRVTVEVDNASFALLDDRLTEMLRAVASPGFSMWRVSCTLSPALRGAEVMAVTTGYAPEGWITLIVRKAVRYCWAEAASR